MEITEKYFLGKGIAKIVYQHPEDKNICIKFPNPNKKRALKDIQREITYLKRHQDHFTWLAPYFGEIETNLGISLCTIKRVSERLSLTILA